MVTHETFCSSKGPRTISPSFSSSAASGENPWEATPMVHRISKFRHIYRNGLGRKHTWKTMITMGGIFEVAHLKIRQIQNYKMTHPAVLQWVLRNIYHFSRNKRSLHPRSAQNLRGNLKLSPSAFKPPKPYWLGIMVRRRGWCSFATRDTLNDSNPIMECKWTASPRTATEKQKRCWTKCQMPWCAFPFQQICHCKNLSSSAGGSCSVKGFGRNERA